MGVFVLICYSVCLSFISSILRDRSSSRKAIRWMLGGGPGLVGLLQLPAPFPVSVFLMILNSEPPQGHKAFWGSSFDVLLHFLGYWKADPSFVQLPR